MFTQAKLVFIALFLGIFLTACGTKTSEAEIEIGMSEQEVLKMMGEPSLTQSQKVGSVTSTHIEWTDKHGMLSVQFINGKAQFNQFVASSTKK